MYGKGDMNKKDILEKINEFTPVTVNPIKWKVVSYTKQHILITNDYDSSVLFEILFNQGEGKKDIIIKDINGWYHNVGYLIQGSDWFTDFEFIEDGICQAIKKVVKFFYNYY